MRIHVKYNLWTQTPSCHSSSPAHALFLHVGKDKAARKHVHVRLPLDKTATHTAGLVFWLQGKVHYL